MLTTQVQARPLPSLAIGIQGVLPIWAAPGQVASSPTLQQDDLAAQGAETPLDEEATKAALQSKGCQIQDVLPHALQELM